MAKIFEGKVALVTGASRGIGAATATALAAQGAHVILTARTAKDLEAVEDAIFEAGGSATIAPLDLTDGDSIARLAAAVTQRWGKLDILILNAAMLGTLSPVSTIDGAEFARLFTLNVSAQQVMIASFDALLRKSEAGRLVALTSSVGATPRAISANGCPNWWICESLIFTIRMNMARVRKAIRARLLAIKLGVSER